MQKKQLTGLQAVPVCAVTLTGRDTAGTLHGPLAAARRTFFEKNRTVRTNGTENARGVVLKYNGKISRTGLLWKEKSATGAYCRTFTLRGEDMLLYYDAKGKLSRRLVFRNSMWLRSDYFEPENSALAVQMLAADPEQEAILYYSRCPGEDTFTKEVLLPVKMPEDAALHSYVNSELGEPQVLLHGMRGVFMYCTEEEKNLREVMYAAGLPEPEEMTEDAPDEAEMFLPEDDVTDEPAFAGEPAAEPVEETALTAPAKADLTFTHRERVYRYVGSLQNGQRHGRGRTEQESGLTAYDGEYSDGKKEGFGSLYYKNGGLCYAGSWKDNRRHGLGVSFRKEDNSLHVGKWQDGERVGMDFLFDKDGRLCVIRDSGDGEEKTVFCIDNSGTVITGLPDAPGNGRGSEFDDDGNIVYTGMHKNGLRHGEGTSFREDGGVEFTGRWENGVFVDGIAFGPNGAGKYTAIL